MTTADQLKTAYHKHRKRKVLVILSFFIAVIVAAVISAGLGSVSIPFNEVMDVLFSRIFPWFHIKPESTMVQYIILNLRLPRIILAIVAGVGLAASGATMQGTLRNPLVSSYTLGISAAAGFGAALAIITGISVIAVSSKYAPFGGYVIIANAFVFSLIAMVLVFTISRLRGMTTETVILAGVAIGYLFSAMLAVIQFTAPSADAVRAVVFWLMGGLYDATWTDILIILPIVVVTVLLMIQQSWNINVMSMGQDVSTSLGINPRRVLAINMVLETLATASIIAFVGVIGFVDLISPHIARMLVGNDHRFLIPCASLIGAFMLLCSDTVARMIINPSELPVGIVTSLLGVPFFIYMLVSRKRQSWR